MISIIDYGVGNLRSVQKAFEKVGAQAVVTHDIKVIESSDKVVLPGVGAIAPAMEKLKTLNLIEPIYSAVKSGKPFLGICVGFQLLFDRSTEGGDVKALGLISGVVDRFHALKVPQMGWNQIHIEQKDCPLFKGIEDNANVYFCHSYYAKPEQENVIAATTDYGISYCSVVSKDNIYGVQFHPEKSQHIGLKILENFVRI